MHKEKQQLRDAVRKRLAALSDKDRAAESRSLCRRLRELLPKESVVVCAFAPLQTEPDIRPLLLRLLGTGGQLFLPRVEAGRIVFRRIAQQSSTGREQQYTSILMDAGAGERDVGREPLPAQLQRGAFGILEPSLDAPLLDPATLSHALIPGRAFDRSGNRLGRGNGGYDRWIAREREANPAAVFWGVCFECQLVQEVPVEAHDQRVDAVVTARGIAS